MPSAAHSSQTLVAAAQDSWSKIDLEGQSEKTEPSQEWTPTKKEWLVMTSLAFISLMVSLDATILVTVLPVSIASLSCNSPSTYEIPIGNC